MKLFDLDFLRGVEDVPGVVMNDFPFSGYIAELLSEEARTILTKITINKRCVRAYGSVYMYIPDSGMWCHTRSDYAARYVCTLLGHKNVSVNYAVAAEPYLEVMERHTCSFSPPIISVCIGNYRLLPILKDNSVVFNLITDLVDELTNEDSTDRIVSSVCIAPISNSLVPYQVDCSRMSKLEETLCKAFSPSQMDVLMWTLGNSILDGTSNHKVLYLFGEGGNGKSFAINGIMDNLKGICCVLSRDYLGSTKYSITDKDLVNMITNKIVVIGDVEPEVSGVLNHKFIKMLGGGDTISANSVQGILRCTGIFASNDLFYSTVDTKQRWFVRRVIVLHMTNNMMFAPPSSLEYSDCERLDFVCRCIQFRMQNENMPMTIEIALVSMFGKSVDRYTRGTKVDKDAIFVQCMAATYIISVLSNVPYSSLVELVALLSPSLIVTENNMNAIASMTPNESVLL